jgi:hypothetical protein
LTTLNKTTMVYHKQLLKLMISIFLIVFSISAIGQVPNYITVPTGFVDSDKLTIDFIGGGAVSQGVSSATGKTLGTGSSGISFYKPSKFQGAVLFSLGSNGDIDFTNSQKNGSAILLPGNGGQSLQLDFRLYNLFKVTNLGMNLSFLGSSSEWRFNNESLTANPISFKLQGSYKILDEISERMKLLLTTDLGFSFRSILNEASENPAFMKGIFGTTKSSFAGFEWNVDLWVNDTRFFFSLPYIFGEKVRGLTNGQIIIGAAVSGKVFRDL